MDKAEQMGFKRYKDNPYYGGHMKQRVGDRRFGYIEGYRQAEKDLALTREDVAKIDAIILDVNNEFAVDYSKEVSRQKFYEEVLKRFNEQRKK